MPKKEKTIEPIHGNFGDVVSSLVKTGQGSDLKIPIVVYSGSLPIGDIELDCAVLEDGTRVLSERAVHRAFGSKRGGAHWKRLKEKRDGANLPSFISAGNLNPFINNDLESALTKPIKYSLTKGGAVANGLRAELLPEICGVWLEARRNNELHPSQEHLARQAEILMQAFAKVGIIALVDEATGFQHDRKHDALRLLLSKYIAEGLQKWLPTFPDSFFLELDSLYNNEPTTSQKRPQYYGHFINKYIYKPIENGYVKNRLDELNIDDRGKRKARFHQWLSDDGRTILIHQIGRVHMLMEMCSDLEQFKNAATKQKRVTIAPYLFDEMNQIIN